MKSLLLMIAGLSAAPVFDSSMLPEDRVTIEGSSTIAPYARELTNLLRHKDMLTVIQNGSGSGLASLCGGTEHAPEIAAASRLIKDKEIRRCADHGIDVLLEKPIGKDGIVIAQSSKSTKIELTARDIYLATANHIPRGNNDCVLKKNRHTKWNDIRDELPDREITVIGPPRSSGTRDVFIDKALEAGARSFPCLASIEKVNADYFRKATRVRLDSHWIDGGEHDEAVAQTLHYVREAVGIFGYAYIHNAEGIEAIPFEGVMPTRESIASGDYQLSRGLYLYTSKSVHDSRRAVGEVFRAFDSFGAIGPGGILTEMGLVTSGHGEPVTEIDTHAGRPVAAAEREQHPAPGTHGDDQKMAAEHAELKTAPHKAASHGAGQAGHGHSQTHSGH